jgi:hypothetical protein
MTDPVDRRKEIVIRCNDCTQELNYDLDTGVSTIEILVDSHECKEVD